MGVIKTKWPKQDNQNRLRSPKPEGGDTLFYQYLHYLRTVNFTNKYNYVINHASAKALTTGRMIHSGTDSAPAEISTKGSNKNVLLGE